MALGTYTRMLTVMPGRLWYIAHYNDSGVMCGLEEHTHYAGGHVRCSRESWDETLIALAGERNKQLVQDFLITK